jgi:hypothetical protein
MLDFLNCALNIYEYGSVVYGTYIDGKSDKDYIVIVPDDYTINTDQVEHNNCHYNIFHAAQWQQKLNNNEVDAIEVYFLPKKHVVKETIVFTTEIVPSKIREQFSRTASNSWVKCKKKLIVEDSFNPRVGKKSLWHSLRIIEFGTQILLKGSITNYDSLNYLYDAIVNNDNNIWEHYQNNYQPIYNKMKTEFRLAEKGE